GVMQPGAQRRPIVLGVYRPLILLASLARLALATRVSRGQSAAYDAVDFAVGDFVALHHMNSLRCGNGLRTRSGLGGGSISGGDDSASESRAETGMRHRLRLPEPIEMAPGSRPRVASRVTVQVEQRRTSAASAGVR